MSTNVYVSDRDITVNGKNLHEVILPECVDRVIAGSSCMSYEFLKNKKVVEVCGKLDGVNQALRYFTPRFINIERIDNDDQVSKIPTGYVVVIVYVSSNVNLELFNNRYDIFLSPARIPFSNKTTPTKCVVKNEVKVRVTSAELLSELQQVFKDFVKTNKIPDTLEEIKTVLAVNVEEIVKDCCKYNNMYELTKLKNINKYTLFKFCEQKVLDDLADKYCTAKQRKKLDKLDSIC